MTLKIGRNEPCTCGSGKKYKQCCGKPAAAPEVSPDSTDGAVERAVAWLAVQHRKAFVAALEEEIDSTVLACFDEDEEAADAAMASIELELWEQIQLNLTESLLAVGDIIVEGEYRRVSELLLGRHGPLLTVGQRGWLAQLAEKPLRLYDITDVVPGSGMTLCDALDVEQPPIVVTEHSASRGVRPGQQIGARVMAVAGHCEFSAAIYPFSMMSGRAVLEDLRGMLAQPSPHDADNVLMVEYMIISGWLTQHLRPAPLPQLVHATSGEALLFISDHFEVLDWDALAGALAALPDVEGSLEAGWDRLYVGADGQTRTLATVAPQPDGQRVSLLTKTAGLADSGRLWFEGLAGDAVRFLLREVSDPRGVLGSADVPGASVVPAPSLPADMDPKALEDAIEAIIKRKYANWADEPVPALNGQTPRQALAGSAGPERVKGLLRSYQIGEQRMAEMQGRREISYQFLWEELGLVR